VWGGLRPDAVRRWTIDGGDAAWLDRLANALPRLLD